MKKPVTAFGAVVFASVVLASCGGGSGGSAPPLQSSSGPGGETAQTSQAITAAQGGTVSTSVAGITTTVTVPAGALAANATVALTVYGNASSVPDKYAGSFESGFSITDGGTPLLMPLSVTVSGTSANSGTGSLLLYSKQTGTFTTVDKTTALGTVTNQNATGYAGISSASGLPYVFSSAPPVAPVALDLTVVAATPGPYAIGTSATFTATGTDANGNAYAFTPTFSLDNAAVGTIAPSTSNPGAATITFGSTQTTGNVIVTDKRTGDTGKLNISVLSQRPANGGDTYAYAGTLTQTFDRIQPTAMPVSTTTENVTQSILVKSGQTFQGQSGLYDFSLSESDATPLKTTTSTSDSYYGFSAAGANLTDELEYGSQWADESGDTLATTYTTPLIVDEIPEAGGLQWSNGAAATIYENISNDANGQALTSHRVYNADGSYTETTTYPPGYIEASQAQSTITQNGDGSGTYLVPLEDGFINYITYSAPQPVPSSTPVVNINVYLTASPPPGAPPAGTSQLAAWFPSSPTLYSETDVDNGMQAFASSCNVPAAFGTQGMQLVQTINRLDTVIGYSETQTTDSYVVNGYGPVCIQLNDVQSEYYAFGDDAGNLFNSTPYQTTTTTETLALQQSGTSVIAAAKHSSATTATRVPTVGLLNAAKARFAFTVDQTRIARERAFAKNASRLTGRHGGL